MMKSMRKSLLFLIVSISACACSIKNAASDSLRILACDTMPSVPSASGITNIGNRFLVNADNSPFLYVFDSGGALRDSLPLLHENIRLHEVPKPIKSDYEAATIVRAPDRRRWLLLLGSGSKHPHRDSALMLSLDEPQVQRKASLQPLFEQMIAAGIPAGSINIEAAAGAGSRIIIFNRGDNSVIAASSDTLLNALFYAAELPVLSARRIILPPVNGFNPGISGATMLDDSTVLFCASVEATTDWAKDGEILGSGIGVLRMQQNKRPTLLSWQMLKSSSGTLMQQKLEGLEVLRRHVETVILRCVADNDDASSLQLDIELRLPRELIER